MADQSTPDALPQSVPDVLPAVPKPTSEAKEIGQKLDDGVERKLSHDVEAEFYTVTEKNGVCVIVYYTHYPAEVRNGTLLPDVSELVSKLKDVWETRGYLVLIDKNLSEQGLYDKMREVASMKVLEKDDASLVCILLPYGAGGKLHAASDKLFQLHKLAGCFAGKACDSLVGKPKLFFIDAYGREPVGHKVDSSEVRQDEPVPSTRIPELADFFFAFSTPPGYYDRGHHERGRFATELCDILEDKSERTTEVDLYTLMEKVTDRMCNLLANNSDAHVPSYMSTLTKGVKLRSIATTPGHAAGSAAQ